MYITAWRAPLSFRARRGRVYKKLGAKRGMEGRTAEERPLWFIIPRKFCFSSVHANCVRVHPSFSLSRLTEQPSLRPVPFRACFSRRIVVLSLRSLALFVPRHLSKWLTASFIIRLSAFLHFYPKLSRLSIVPAANSYGHNTVLKDFNMRIIVTVSSVLLSFDSVL